MVVQINMHFYLIEIVPPESLPRILSTKDHWSHNKFSINIFLYQYKYILLSRFVISVQVSDFQTWSSNPDSDLYLYNNLSLKELHDLGTFINLDNSR